MKNKKWGRKSFSEVGNQNNVRTMIIVHLHIGVGMFNMMNGVVLVK